MSSPAISTRRCLRRLLSAVLFSSIPIACFGEGDEADRAIPVTRERTRTQLLEDVAESWTRPASQPERDMRVERARSESPLLRKLEAIVIPNVNFTRAEIGHVVTALSAISAEFDPTDSSSKGVNIILVDPGAAKSPLVTVTLRNVSLKRALDFVTSAIDYHYELQNDAVIVRAGGESSVLETEFFPIARATALRMAGGRGASDGLQSKSGTPATLASSANPVSEGSAYEAEARAIKGFLQQAGVNFDLVAGSSLAYDGSAVIVTQTASNLDRARTILRRYTHVRQVEIEAKFMEVQEGALEELGVNWTIGQKQTQHNGIRATYSTSARSLAAAFSNTIGNQQGRIVRPETATTNADGALTFSTPIDIPIVNNAPSIPGSPSLAAAANPLATISGIVGEFDVNAIVRALSEKQGTDLLSAPKVTVLSGNPATMTVAQEMRYPRSFGQTQSQVGTGSASGGGSAGVAITAGTPQDFTSRNIGVELKVTPTVEEDDYSISLDLNPRVTEFDGFVEYGGPSIAISGGTTVTVPSGFFQPIFSVRDISTKVTIWDGATIVMGGLTREEVKRVSDKVPILGSLPLVGRMFRSKGQSAQKRNLLIFLTANLVSPGGAHAHTERPRLASVGNARRSGFSSEKTVETDELLEDPK